MVLIHFALTNLNQALNVVATYCIEAGGGAGSRLLLSAHGRAASAAPRATSSHRPHTGCCGTGGEREAILSPDAYRKLPGLSK